jgi:hypothetical protein
MVGLRATAVPLDHEFENGERFRITLTSSRNGYVFLLDRGADHNLHRLWPATGGAIPIAARETVLVPPDGQFRLGAATGTDTVRIVFSLLPLADPLALQLDTDAPGRGAAAPIRQIRLRGELGRDDAAAEFTGEIVERGVAVLDLNLVHRARR